MSPGVTLSVCCLLPLSPGSEGGDAPDVTRSDKRLHIQLGKQIDHATHPQNMCSADNSVSYLILCWESTEGTSPFCFSLSTRAASARAVPCYAVPWRGLAWVGRRPWSACLPASPLPSTRDVSQKIDDAAAEAGRGGRGGGRGRGADRV